MRRVQPTKCMRGGWGEATKGVGRAGPTKRMGREGEATKILMRMAKPTKLV